MGNKIYGCDDCQVVCPWNKYAVMPSEQAFMPHHNLDNVSLLDCFHWNKKTFKQIIKGSAMTRVRYEGFIRNVAIALGNAPYSETIIHALQTKENDENDIIREHVVWALEQQNKKSEP